MKKIALLLAALLLTFATAVHADGPNPLCPPDNPLCVPK
jgi:hypothetical protein